MILLFEEDETKFDSLGLGVLRDATECTVAEGLNDQYTLELKYPVKGQNFDKIRENRLIYCKPNPFDEPQPFRIASISRPINGIVTVDANHISYDMNGIPVNVFKGANFLDTINNIKKNCIVDNKFNFINAHTIDKKFYKTFELTAPTNLKALLTATGESGTDSDDSTTGSIGSVYDVEFKYDRWNVIFYSHRGSDKGVEVRYSKNRTDLTQETTTENLYSAVYPFYHKTTTSTTTNTTDAGFTKVYIVGKKPFQDGWLSYSEGGEPYHPVDESGVQIATEGQYKDKIYCWNSKISRYEEKVYNQSVTLIEGMGKDPEWIKIDWSKFPVVSCNAVKDGYFKKLTDTSGWTFHKAGDVVFDGKVTDLSNISSNRIIYYSEVIPASESSSTTETSKTVHVELDEKLIKLTTDDAKARKHQYVLPLDLSSEFDAEPTKEKLKQKAEQYIKKHKLGKIKKSTDVSFIDLWNITESDNLKVLKSVEIGDTVSVVYPDLGVDEKLRVISTEYNALLDAYTKIELGEKKDTLSDSSVSTGDNVSSLTNDTGYTDENKVSQIVAQTVSADYIQAINAKLSKAQIDQLQTERIKCTGILEASQFEIDKLVAKRLVAENATISQTLTAGQIKVSGDIDIKSGQINITGDDGTVFKVDREGHVTANGLNITGGSIEIQNSENNTSFSVNSDGYLVANGAKIYGEIIANSGSIGGCEIVDGELKVPAANITGEINIGNIDQNGKDAITKIVNDTIETTNVEAKNLKVGAANISGQLTIGQLDDSVTSDLDAAKNNANNAATNANSAASSANSAADRVKNAENEYSSAKDAYSDAQKASEDAASKLSDAKTKLNDAQTNYDNASKAYGNAKTDSEAAASKLDDAQTNYNNAKGAYDTAKADSDAATSKLNDAQTNYNNAKDAYDSAKTDSETATGKLSQAEENLKNATSSYDSAKKASDDAASKLEDAQNQYESTLTDAKSEYDKSVADAKAKYDAAAKDSQDKIDAATKQYQDSVAAAESSYNDKVADATKKYNDAETANKTASSNLSDAQAKLTDATSKYNDAEKANSDATSNLSDAKTKLDDASSKYNDAEAANTEAVGKLADAQTQLDSATSKYDDAKKANASAETNLNDAKNQLETAQAEYGDAKKANEDAAEKLKDAEAKYTKAVDDYNAASANLANKLSEGQQGAANLVEQRLKNAQLGGNKDITGFIYDKDGIRSFSSRNADNTPVDNYNSLTTKETNGVYLSNTGLRMGEMPSTSPDDYDSSDQLNGQLSKFFTSKENWTLKLDASTLNPDDYFQIVFDVVGTKKGFDLNFSFYSDTTSTVISKYIVHVPSDSSAGSSLRSKRTISSPSNGDGRFRVPTSWKRTYYVGVSYSYDGDEAVVGNVRIFKLYPKGLVELSDGTIIGTEMYLGGATVKNGVLSVPAANITGKVTADIVESNEGHIAGFDIEDGKLVNGSFVKLPSDSEMATLKKARDDAHDTRMSARNDVNLAESTLEEVQAYADKEKAASSDGNTLSEDTQKSLTNAQTAVTNANKEYTDAYNAWKIAKYNYDNAGTPISIEDATVDSVAAKSTSSSPKPALYIGTDGIHLNQRISDGSDTITESNFKVTADGKIQANDCEIDGKITVTDGQVGGLYISDKSISYPKEFSKFDKATSYKTIKGAIIGGVVVGKDGTIISLDPRLEFSDKKIVDDAGVYIGADGIRIGRNAKDYIENYIDKGATYPYSLGGTIVKQQTGFLMTKRINWEKDHGGLMIDKYGKMYIGNASMDGTFYGNLYPNLSNDPFRYISKVVTSELPDNTHGFMYIGTLMKTTDSNNAGAIHITGIVGPWVGEKQVIDIVISTRGGLSVSGFVHGGNNVPYNFDIVATDGYSQEEEDILGNKGTKDAPCYAIFLSFTNYYFINLNVNSIGAKKRTWSATKWDEVIAYHYDGKIISSTDSSSFTDTNKVLSPYIRGYDGHGNPPKVNVKSILEKHLNCPWSNPESTPISGNFNILFTDVNNNLICSTVHTTSSSDSVTFKTGGNSETSFSIKGANGTTYDLSSMPASVASVFNGLSKSNFTFEDADHSEYSSIANSVKVYILTNTVYEDKWWSPGTFEGVKAVFASQSYDTSGTSTSGSLSGTAKLQGINVNITSNGTVWVGNDGHPSKVWIMVICEL